MHALAILTAATLCLGACGADTTPPAKPARFAPELVHDLVALLPEAEALGSSIYRVQRQAMQPEADPRSLPPALRLRVDAELRFLDLRTERAPRLSFRPGLLTAQDAAPKGAVRLRVHGTRRAAAADAVSEHLLFDDVVDPADFDAQQLGEPLELALPGEGVAFWTLHFSSPSDGSRDPGGTWLGLFGPRLESTWNGESHARPVRLETLHLDLLDALQSASSLREAQPDDIARTTLDAAEGVAGVGGRRACLRLPAPARVAWEIELPAESELVFDFGLDTQTGWQLPGDGTTFAVEVNGERVWSTFLNAHNLRRDRGWKPARIALDAWAGERVELALLSESGDDAANDIAAFADARVISAEQVPRLALDAAPSVVLVCVDTLRADHVTPELLPRTSAFADEGLRYTGARSSSSWTWPATASLLTGLPPTTHRVVGAHSSHLADGMLTLAERFAEAGYSTGAFVGNPIVGTADNFDQGFEAYVHLPNARGALLNESVRNWLRNTQGSARFLYLHYYDPHAPYLPLGDFAAVEAAAADKQLLADLWERSQAGDVDMALAETWASNQAARYASEMVDVDTNVSALLAMLEAELGDDWVLALTSDHGEEFLDHGQVSHGPQLFDETLAAPLLLVGRGALRQPPAVIHDVLETRALPNTLLELAGLPLLPGDQRRLPLRPKAQRPEPAFAQTLHGIEPGVQERVEKRAVLHAGAKLIHTPSTERVELYDLLADPGELHDLAAEHPERVALLRRFLDDWLERTTVTRGARDLSDAAAVERLRELGYLGEDD